MFVGIRLNGGKKIPAKPVVPVTLAGSVSTTQAVQGNLAVGPQ